MSGEVPRQVLNSEYLLVDTTRAWWGRSQGIYLNANVTSLKNRWLLLRGNNHSSDTVQFMQFTGLAYGFNYSKQHNNAFNLHKITKIRVKSQKHGRYTGDFPQMPVNTGAPLFIRATWPHWEGGVGANSPLWPRYHPIWFKTSTLKENCLSNYCWGKKRKKN